MTTKFQQRHFEAIASMMQSIDRELDRHAQATIIAALVDLFVQDNPRFDVGRFERACITRRECSQTRLLIGG